jgi:hypothetical protein
MSVFCLPAYASGSETLTVTAAWVDGELLRINVTDINGVSSALALRLSDYVSDSENKEYISIQAIDLAGNKSGIIEIKNPYYDPSAAPVIIVTPAEQPQSSQPTQSSQSAIPDGSKPFTPDGTGTVMDNAHDGDGKEFFTIGTEDGSVFYLIVDRQRNADNVYLLNAVTEEDLMALAAKNGREITPSENGTSAIPTPEPTTANEPNKNPADSTEPTENPAVTPPEKNDTTMYIIIAVAVIGVGGAGYYFKIVKGKKNNAYDDEEEDEDIYGYGDSADEEDDNSDAEDGGDDE